jgi:hypothetical protein
MSPDVGVALIVRIVGESARRRRSPGGRAGAFPYKIHHLRCVRELAGSCRR